MSVNILDSSFLLWSLIVMNASTVMDLDALRASSLKASRLMKVLSNPDRMLLLCQLAEAEKRVGELESLLGIVQPTLSQQLGVLRDEGLVSTRREGKHIYYRIDSPQALAVMRVLYQQVCDTAEERDA